MAKQYGSSVIPSDQVTVQSGGTVSVSVGFNATVGLVGNMDTANGSASVETVEHVDSVSTARSLFGDGSELHEAVSLAYANGAASVYAVAPSETSTTESFASSQSGTLANTPAIDPNVADEHAITAQDTTEGVSATVNIVYDNTVTAPSSANEINLNPVTGDWKADASSSYDITYEYADYTKAIEEIVKQNLRFAVVGTEATSVANKLLTEVNARASDFEFMRGVVGGDVGVTASNYSDAYDDQRLVVSQPPRAYTDDAASNAVRTCYAVGGYLTSLPLGDSATYDALDGMASLKTEYTNSELGSLIDKQVLPLSGGGAIEVVKDMTTSTDAKFERVYACEVVDEVAALSHEVSVQFVGDLNFDETRKSLRVSHESFLSDMATDRPPLLNDPDGTQPYSVNVSTGASDSEVDVELGVEVVDVIDTIDVTVTVGDVVTNQGAA